jgi:hypothetical protein
MSDVTESGKIAMFLRCFPAMSYEPKLTGGGLPQEKFGFWLARKDYNYSGILEEPELAEGRYSRPVLPELIIDREVLYFHALTQVNTRLDVLNALLQLRLRNALEVDKERIQFEVYWDSSGDIRHTE